MKIRVATICDFAQVREGLLSVVSAGITRLWRPQYPAAMDIMLALLIEIPPDEARIPKEIRVRVENADGTRLVETSAGFQAGPGPQTDPGELLNVPFVLDLRKFELPTPGRYQIVVDPMREDLEPTVLAFRAGFPTDAGRQ